MIFSIDITESFGAIDFDNAGGIATYIRISTQKNIDEKFSLEMSNFILNLIDTPVILSINSQSSDFMKYMTEDGFLIISKAKITFEAIKGHEKLIRLKGQAHEYLLHEVYGRPPENDDKIYDFSGLTHSTPELIINFSVISPRKVTLEFDPLDHSYIESHEEFIESIQLLNSNAKKPQIPIQGLFNTDFSNLHTIGNFETGYRTYKSSY